MSTVRLPTDSEKYLTCTAQHLEACGRGNVECTFPVVEVEEFFGGRIGRRLFAEVATPSGKWVVDVSMRRATFCATPPAGYTEAFARSLRF